MIKKTFLKDCGSECRGFESHLPPTSGNPHKRKLMGIFKAYGDFLFISSYNIRMKQELKENGGLPAHILWTLAIVAGVSVANIYYNQPLLNLIRQELDITEFSANLIAMITQVGYALGLLLIIPLGDLYPRKKIIQANFALLICSLLTMAVSKDIHVIWGASLLTGVGSMIPQIFVPIVSPARRTRGATWASSSRGC